MHAENTILKSELRGEKRLYGLAALTTAFAAAALTLVLGVGDSFERTFAASAKVLLGGDVEVRLRQRDFLPQEVEYLGQNSRAVSFIRVAGVLAVAGEQNQMARLKTADAAYPLYGKLQLKDGDADATRALLLADADANGIYSAAVASELLELLSLQLGDTFTAAGLTLRVVHIITAEPDPDARMWMATPLILIGESALAGKQHAAPGMLSSRYARVLLPQNETAESWSEKLAAAFPNADWRVRPAAQAMPSLRRFVEQMRDFLSLLSLAAMLTAGIGVGGAAAAFLRARTRAIAVIKMLGGSEKLIIRIYLKMAALFVGGGALLGAVVGALLLFQVSPLLSAFLPITLTPMWPWAALGQSFSVAALMGAAAALMPVLRAARVNPLALFKSGDNDAESPPHSRRDILWGVILCIVVVLLLPLDWREKAAALGIAGGAFCIYLLSLICARAAGGLAKIMPPTLAWGFLAVSRNRRQTANGAVALGTGLALLIAILNIEGNFAARINDTLRQQSPSLFLLGVQEGQQDNLREKLTEAVGGKSHLQLRTIPFLRGRVQSLGGRAAAALVDEVPPDYKWILRGDRGLTWTDSGGYIGASRIVAGKFWDSQETRPQASFEKEAADIFGLQLGDELELSILGERLTAVITNLREVDWQSFDINFVIILDRRPFDSAPYSLMGAAFLPPAAESAARLAVARNFPNITPIPLSTVFNIVQRLLKNISLLLQAAVLFMLAAAAPVVAAALMESQRRRVQESVALRLLGAPTAVLTGKGLAEFMAMAAAAVLPALCFGLLAGRVVVREIFDLPWELAGAPFLVAAGGVILFMLAGCASIFWISRLPPLSQIRND